MKTSVFTLLLIASIIASSFGASTPNATSPKEKHIKVIFSSRDIFYFKVGHHWLGGNIEIYDEAGKLIAVEPIGRRKMIVDFFDVVPGTYIVKLKKNDSEEDFKYVKATTDEETSNKVAFYSMDPLLTIDLKFNFKKDTQAEPASEPQP